MTDADILLAAVRAQTRVLKLPTVGRECDPLARQALAEAWPPLQYLRSLLDAELATRAERAIGPATATYIARALDRAAADHEECLIIQYAPSAADASAMLTPVSENFIPAGYR